MNQIVNSQGARGNGDVSAEIATAAPMDVLDAAYHTAHRYPGGVATLALRMGMKASTLNHKVSVTNHTHHLTVQEAVLMQAMSGDCSVLHSMAASLGHVALKLDPTAEAQPMAEVARMVREFSELLTRVTGSLEDGTVTLNEVRGCQKEAMDAIAAIHSVMGAVRAMLPEHRA